MVKWAEAEGDRFEVLPLADRGPLRGAAIVKWADVNQ